jgi:hypothetical protein
MKKLWYKPFLAIVTSTMQLFGALIYVFTEVLLGFKSLPKLVCKFYFTNLCLVLVGCRVRNSIVSYCIAQKQSSENGKFDWLPNQ